MTKDLSRVATEPLVLNRSQVRLVDQIAIEQFGIPGIALMENAGRGCFERLLERGVAGPVVVCCGPGNNGGDGFVIARHLDNAGMVVKVILAGVPKQMSGDAETNLQIIQKMEIPILVLPELPMESWLEELQFVDGERTAWIVDALLGTGASGPPRAPMDRLIEMMNSLSAKRMAVDIPTGIDCDTGVCHQSSFDADLTCTFVARKPAFAIESAQRRIGEVEVIDIGAPISVIRQVLNE